MSSDCQTCGACCFSDSTSYVPLTRSDRRRFADPGELAHVVDGHWHMRLQGNASDRRSPSRCIALRLVGGSFVCSIYQDRPQICRELQRGSPACLEETREKKARALRLLS